jgi:hypothetical protein
VKAVTAFCPDCQRVVGIGSQDPPFCPVCSTPLVISSITGDPFLASPEYFIG